MTRVMKRPVLLHTINCTNESTNHATHYFITFSHKLAVNDSSTNHATHRLVTFQPCCRTSEQELSLNGTLYLDHVTSHITHHMTLTMLGAHLGLGHHVRRELDVTDRSRGDIDHSTSNHRSSNSCQDSFEAIKETPRSKKYRCNHTVFYIDHSPLANPAQGSKKTT